MVLAYLVLGAFYLYARIEESRQTAAAQPTSAAQHTTESFAQLYDPKGFVPDVLPDAQLDCDDAKGPWLKYSGKAPMCSVMIDNKIAAVMTRQEVKDNLAGSVTIYSGTASEKTDNATKKDAPPPCPTKDPLGLYTKSPCAPLPAER